jgi:hypothetical protein
MQAFFYFLKGSFSLWEKVRMRGVINTGLFIYSTHPDPLPEGDGIAFL